MCGLAGMAGDITLAAEKVFRDVLTFNSIYRGRHSTGMAVVQRDNSTKLIKQLGNAIDFFERNDALQAINAQTKVVIGHGRHATRGQITRNNAHPFLFDNIVGAHNGTLDNKHDIEGKDEFFGTDSEALFNLLDKEGAAKAVPKLKGAWALTWFDYQQNTINFVRNDKRPLWFAFSEDGKILFWSSEVWMLETAFYLHNFKYKAPFQIEVDKWLAWEVPAVNATFPRAKMRKLEGAPERNWNYNYSATNRGSYSVATPYWSVKQQRFISKEAGELERQAEQKAKEEARKSNEAEDAKGEEKPASNIVTLPVPTTKGLFETIADACKKKVERFDNEAPGPDGTILDREGWNRATHNKCAWCASDAEWEHRDEIQWISQDQFICHECLSGPDGDVIKNIATSYGV